jgi:UDP-2-acetamido-3-amino-2,3-dideoxy-glucuronate N-acetyltransferase
LIDHSAEVDPSARIPESAVIWGTAQVRERAVLGEAVVVGRGAYIGVGVTVGDGSKIQNSAMVYEPARLGVGVFVGPGAILTNDRHPRAVTPLMRQKTASDWESRGVDVLDGASVGAGAICVAPVRIGRWAMIAAGAVVVRDVPDHGLVAGIPARQIGWVGRSGVRLVRDDGSSSCWTCPMTAEKYKLATSGLKVVQDLSG